MITGKHRESTAIAQLCESTVDLREEVTRAKAEGRVEGLKEGAERCRYRVKYAASLAEREAWGAMAIDLDRMAEEAERKAHG